MIKLTKQIKNKILDLDYILDPLFMVGSVELKKVRLYDDPIGWILSVDLDNETYSSSFTSNKLLHEALNKLKKLCLHFDPYAAYIESLKQQKEQMRRNQDIKDQIIKILSEVK